jgi:hypothetical protein
MREQRTHGTKSDVPNSRDCAEAKKSPPETDNASGHSLIQILCDREISDQPGKQFPSTVIE